MNKVILIGNLTRVIELRHLPSGSAVAKTGIATSRKWKDKQTGESKEEVMFVDLVFYGKGAEIANQYLTKGKKVAIEGRLVLEQWADQTGQNRSKHSVSVDEFEMLGSKQDSEAETEEAPKQQTKKQKFEVDEESIPF